MTLLPRLTPENHLNRIQKYFSFMGYITETAIIDQDEEICTFHTKAQEMFAFLEQFKRHIKQME